MKRKPAVVLSALAGLGIFLLINLFVLHHLLVPDPCAWHVRKPGWLMDVFYAFPSFTGCHPVPSVFNLLLTAGCGALGGWVLAKLNYGKTNEK